VGDTKTKVRSPQINAICEQFLNAILQADPDEWLHHYNTNRTHQGEMCCDSTPFHTMFAGKNIWKVKFVTWI